MGYAMVAVCTDHGDVIEAAAELREALRSVDTHAGGRSPRWTLCEAWHSSEAVAVRISASGSAEVLAGHGVAPTTPGLLNDDAWGFDRKVSVGQMAEVTRSLRRDMRAAQQVAVHGIESVVGRRSAPPATASVWLVRCDGLGSVLAEPTGLAERMEVALTDRWSDCCGPAGYPQAIEHLGSFTATDGEVLLVWSGNRVCEPSRLTERERQYLTPRWG
jgi:hypothetical protein